MTKPTMELVEEFGFIRYRAGCVGHKSHEELNATSAALLSEIRQRLEAMERDAARYRWLRYNASFTIHSFLFGEPSMAHHAESDLDAAIDQQMEPNP